MFEDLMEWCYKSASLEKNREHDGNRLSKNDKGINSEPKRNFVDKSNGR